MPHIPAPIFDNSKLIRGQELQIPIGNIVEYALPDPAEGSLAVGIFDGAYPCWEGDKWCRNTQVAEWYVMRKGEAQVTIEGQPPVTLKVGEEMYLPVGVWYRAVFRNAHIDMPSVPAWTPRQHERKA